MLDIVPSCNPVQNQEIELMTQTSRNRKKKKKLILCLISKNLISEIAMQVHKSMYKQRKKTAELFWKELVYFIKVTLVANFCYAKQQNTKLSVLRKHWIAFEKYTCHWPHKRTLNLIFNIPWQYK